MVWVLADDIRERICSCSFSKCIVPLAFEVLGELKGTDIESSGGLVRERVIVINWGIGDRKVFARDYMVSRWSITSVDNSVEDRVFIFACKCRRDGSSILKSALGVVRGDKA